MHIAASRCSAWNIVIYTDHGTDGEVIEFVETWIIHALESAQMVISVNATCSIVITLVNPIKRYESLSKSALASAPMSKD